MAEDDGDSFALLDFALTQAPVREVAQALAATAPPDHAQRTDPVEDRGLTRVWSRLRRLASPPSEPPRTGLYVQPDDLIPDGPLTRLSLDAAGSAAEPSRLSGPLGPHAYTLIERCLPAAAQPTAPDDPWAQLSAALGPAELFCFRYSGLTHPGADFQFRVLTAGRTTRDVRAHSPEGTSVEAGWQGHDTGMPHPFEAESLPPPGAAPMTLMNATRLASILAAMDLAPEDLFYDVAARRDMLILSDAPQGTALATVLARTGTGPLRANATGKAQPPITSTQTPATSHPTAPNDTLAPEQPATARDTVPHAAAHARLPTSPESWEDEVTAILVAAVEAGLPEEDQVPWLDALTGQLNSGDIDGALTRAAELIRHGDRPAEQRISAAARLAALFEVRNDGVPLR